jgi:hypothetical protein
MDNLTCGTDVNGNPIAVDNARRNKGKFIADWSYATQSEYPELAEAFLHLREQACIVDIPTCASDPGYPQQSYNSANDPCSSTSTTLTFTPLVNALTNTYQVPRDSILCNNLNILNPPIEAATLTLLVASLNTNLSSMGVWAVSGLNITLVGSVCTTVAIPWVI